MSLTTEGMTPADLAAVTGNNGGMFGGDGAWWLIVLFLFIFAGGWGNAGYGAGGVSENYTLVSDMGQIERKIDGVYSGICDSTFALNNTARDGFANLNTALTSQGYETRNAITQAQMAQMQSANQLTAQIADCCCQARYDALQNSMTTNKAISDGFCQTNFNNATNTRDVIDNQNANARAILEAINANKVEALKDRIAEQNQQINSLTLAASQAAQNEYLISQLKPCPQGAYLVANPNGALNYTLNTGCGCNC